MHSALTCVDIIPAATHDWYRKRGELLLLTLDQYWYDDDDDDAVWYSSSFYCQRGHLLMYIPLCRIPIWQCVDGAIV